MNTGSAQGQTANELLGVPLPQAAWSCIRPARYHNLLHFQATSITWRLSLFVHIRNRRLHLLRRVSVPPTFIFKRASVYADPPDSVLYRNSPHMKSPTTAKQGGPYSSYVKLATLLTLLLLLVQSTRRPRQKPGPE